MQKMHNKVRTLRQVKGFTRFSSIWYNNWYNEPEKLQYDNITVWGYSFGTNIY